MREVPRGRVGTSELRVDVDAETYDRLHELYLDAVDAGYAESFDMFVVNHTRNETRVTIDGEPATPPTPQEEPTDA